MSWKRQSAANSAATRGAPKRRPGTRVGGGPAGHDPLKKYMKVALPWPGPGCRLIEDGPSAGRVPLISLDLLLLATTA